jgi:hypothetical protein
MKLGKWRKEARMHSRPEPGTKTHHLIDTIASNIVLPSLPNPFCEESVTWMGPF